MKDDITRMHDLKTYFNQDDEDIESYELEILIKNLGYHLAYRSLRYFEYHGNFTDRVLPTDYPTKHYENVARAIIKMAQLLPQEERKSFVAIVMGVDTEDILKSYKGKI